MITPRSLLVCRVLGSLLIGSLWGCSPTETEEPGSAELAPLPKGFPAPLIPIENLQSAVKVELGRHLFYDKRMSGNGTQSCASCHKQALGFTDGLAHSVGSTGQMHPRSAMGLTNVAYVSALTWANPLLRTLEEQALGPMFGEHPVELGLAGKEDELLARLTSDARYPALFARAFPGDARPISLANITRALASFERTLISGRSAYDRFLYGNESSALSDAATLAGIARRYGALTIMDCVTSLGGVPVLLDEWGIDAAYSGSQKCLSCTPGLSPVSFSAAAVERIKARKTPCPSWFQDLSLVLGYWSGAKRTYHHTAPVNPLFGLHESLVMLAEEGLENAWLRHRNNHLRLRAGLEAMGLKFVVREDARLPQLNTVWVPEGVDEASVRSRLLNEFGIEIGAGLGALAGRVWRIGLMGHSSRPANIVLFLAALESVLHS